MKQKCRSTAGKISSLLKIYYQYNRPPPKKEKSTTKKSKRINLPQEEALLSLHPTDSSGNEDNDNMSVNTHEGHPDIYI